MTTTHPRIAPLNVQLIAKTHYTPPWLELAALTPGKFKPYIDNVLHAEGGGAYTYDGSALAEFAGRSCYESYDRPNARTATNEGYLAHIMEVGHYSVLEHPTVTFYITGISRSLTHELVRHRHFSFSQLSQRFVDSSRAKMVLPPAYEGDDVATQSAVERFVRSLEEYFYDVERMKESGKTRKQIRETARSGLPNETETKMVITGNYRAWIEFLIKRDSPAADAEIARLARTIGEQLAVEVPNVFGVKAREIWNPKENRS